MIKIKNFHLMMVSAALLFALSCTSGEDKQAIDLSPSNLSGKELAELHCSGCHAFTPPELLDKRSWETGVLPEMSLRLGMGNLFSKLTGMDQQHVNSALALKVYPDRPTMAAEDWEKIKQYFLENAPEKPLPQDRKATVAKSLKGFRLIKKELPLRVRSKNTFVKFNTAEEVVYSAELDGHMYTYDLSLKKKDSLGVFSAVSDVYFQDKGLKILDMGQIDPNDERVGRLIEMDGRKQQRVLIDTLRRPVRAAFGDLDQDGKEDMVICNFGFEAGKLSWINGKTSRETVLRNLPGARSVFILDMNKDGLNDIVALMTQAREGVFVFYNEGKGKFKEKEVLSFSPVFGSSHMQLVDFNKDGFMDIVYTNGDNADYSPGLKKFHGVRIFENDGKNNFREAFFFPVYGAGKSIAADFDLDGDLDLALISYFPDPDREPNEGFLLLENLGSYQFKASSFPGAQNGNWMTMDVADMDNDGDADIVLGSYERSPNRKNTEKYEMVILENLKR